MIFASGYIELNSTEDYNSVKERLNERQISITAYEGDRMTFLIEKEDSSVVKKDLESMKEIEGVRSVYLAYFSLEDSDS
ncbi:MAG: hypothetical protein N2738_09600 [Thermodesulfovibrionales bacterium]|nr:hypothetical protein [Thermodesulfovibrionales bacterium]